MSTMRPERSRQGGFAIFSALFIIVFLALLSAAIATIATGAHQGSAARIQGAQAQQAARAGLEWGLHKAWNGDAAVCSSAGSSSNFATPLQGGMAVTIHCRSTVQAESGTPHTAYAVTAWACNTPDSATGACPGSNANLATGTYVERKAFALIER